MKNTWLAILLVSLVAQAAILSPAHAQVKAAEKAAEKIANFALRKKPKAVAEVVEKAPEAVPTGLKAKMKKYFEEKYDLRFVRSLLLKDVGGLAIVFSAYEGVWPHILKRLCAIESKTSGPRTIFVKPETCTLFYGDAKINSCQVANNGVSLLFPTDRKGIAIRFVGEFKDGKLQSITQAYVRLKSDNSHDFELIGLPVQMFFNNADIAFDLRPYPGVSVLRPNVANRQQSDAFTFYEEVGAVLRLANTECSDGKYDKMLEDISKRHSTSKPAAEVKR